MQLNKGVISGSVTEFSDAPPVCGFDANASSYECCETVQQRAVVHAAVPDDVTGMNAH
jgi:hypothetical protein